ncbi:hypothetical protein B1H18_34735, partial [Streptomyces tsukubensis]
MSAFGISGTNAHVILEEAPLADTGEPEVPAAPDTTQQTRPPVIPWLLSAESARGVRAQAEHLAAHLADHPALDPVDIGFSLLTTRANLDHRAVITGTDRAALTEALRALVTDTAAPGTYEGVAQRHGRLAVMFTGQGAQRVGMGQQLYAAFPVFAQEFDKVCALFDVRLERPLRQVIWAEPDSDDARLVDETVFTQAGLFALEVALFRLAESWGVTPDFLLGHSIGEITAAHVAGVFSLDDAVALVAARGQLMQGLPSGGTMISLRAAESDIRSLLAEYPDVAVAAVNSPSSLVISGEERAVTTIARLVREKGGKAKRLKGNRAFHSPLVEPMLDAFRDVVEGLSLTAPKIPVVSNLTGRPATPEEICTPEYWVRHAREAVRFSDCVQWLSGNGVTTLLELGPDGVLSGLAQQCLAEADSTQVIATLRAARSEPRLLVESLARLHVRGVSVDWAGFFPGARRVGLPTYAFQRERFWLESSGAAVNAAGLGVSAAGHPLLAAAVSLAGDEAALLTGRLSAEEQPWLGEHEIHGSLIVPGTALVELAVRAGDEVGCDV